MALNTILDILPCGNGFAVGAGDPLFALLGPDGTPQLTRSGVIADLRLDVPAHDSLSGVAPVGLSRVPAALL